VGGDGGTNAGNANLISARAAFSADPNGCCLMWDSQQTAAQFEAMSNDNGFVPGSMSAWLEKSTRHHGGENMAFTDGHAKYFRWSNLTWFNLSGGGN